MASHPSATVPDSSCRLEALCWADRPPQRADVLVVGGGFSGLLVAVGILERDPQATIAVVERSPRWAPGVAYGGCEPQHLLNVRADRMGAVAESPGDFHEWLERKFPGTFGRNDFVARSLYGEYLNETVSALLAPHRARISLIRDAVLETDLGAANGSHGGVARLASGARIGADVIVLALGLPAAHPTWQDASRDATPRDPWSDGAFSGLEQDDAIIVVGTGLTALDVLVSLASRSHRGPITFVSRNGRFPLPHSVAAPTHSNEASALDAAVLAAGPKQAFRAVRNLARRCVAAGRPWQDALDAVRPHTTSTWQSWSDRDRSRFLTRIRPFWEIHRHRAPRTVLHLVERGLASGQIRVLCGSIASIVTSRTTPNRVRRLDVSVCLDGTTPSQGTTVIGADRIYHCIGPAMRVHEIPDPLLQSLLSRGVVSSDGAGLGLRADDRGLAIRSDGQTNRALFVLGALRRGDLWESTAVPELRLQTRTVADESVGIIQAARSGADSRPTSANREIRT